MIYANAILSEGLVADRRKKNSNPYRCAPDSLYVSKYDQFQKETVQTYNKQPNTYNKGVARFKKEIPTMRQVPS